MSHAVHCDREGCGIWLPVGTEVPNTFVGITDLNTGAYLAHACSPDCLMHWIAANTEPTYREAL
jgi:hypothetical protein